MREYSPLSLSLSLSLSRSPHSPTYTISFLSTGGLRMCARGLLDLQRHEYTLLHPDGQFRV